MVPSRKDITQKSAEDSEELPLDSSIQILSTMREISIPPPIIVPLAALHPTTTTPAPAPMSLEDDYEMYLGLLTSSHDSEMAVQQTASSFEDRNRNQRLEIGEKVLSAYNNGDFTQLFSHLYDYCDTNVRFVIPAMQIECYGVIPLLAFFVLLSEVYPDSLFQHIERRFATIKVPSPRHDREGAVNTSGVDSPRPNQGHPPLVETVENIDKFIGTRVFDQPVFRIFQELVEERVLESPFLMVADIVSIISTKIYSRQQVTHPLEGPKPLREEKVFTFITETSLTFDLPSNRIIQWSYHILASQSE